MRIKIQQNQKKSVKITCFLTRNSDNNPCDAAARLWIELKGVRSVKQ